jgi:hypothetical protein
MSTEETTTVNPVNIATDASGQEIKLTGNNAHIAGFLHAMGEWSIRTGRHQALVTRRGAQLSSGYMAVDSINTVDLMQLDFSMMDENGLAWSFENPCPADITERIDTYDALATSHKKTKFTPRTAPLEKADGAIYAPFSVKKDDADLLLTYAHACREAPWAEQLVEKAKGSGTAFTRLLIERSAKATGKDKAVLLAKFNALVKNGVQGELTTESFKSHIKAYKLSKRNMAPGSRPPDEVEREMIASIAYADPEVRSEYSIAARLDPAKDFDGAVEQLEEVL